MSTLADALLFVSRLLSKNKVPYAVMGGIALSAWAEPRYTQDIDLTLFVDAQGWSFLKTLLDKNRVRWRIIQKPKDEDFPDLVRFEWKGVLIDLQMSKTDYQQELLKRRKRKKLQGSLVYVVSPEDLFVTKILADRPRDRADLHSLMAHNKKLNWPYIRKWCGYWDIEKRLKAYRL